MSEKKTISVMIPCYNEEQNARPIYEAVRDELVKSCPNYDYEILFIDNKSEDGTRAIIRHCLLYTSDAADEEDSVDLGGRRIIKKKRRRKCNAAEKDVKRHRQRNREEKITSRRYIKEV